MFWGIGCIIRSFGVEHQGLVRCLCIGRAGLGNRWKSWTCKLSTVKTLTFWSLLQNWDFGLKFWGLIEIKLRSQGWNLALCLRMIGRASCCNWPKQGKGAQHWRIIWMHWETRMYQQIKQGPSLESSNWMLSSSPSQPCTYCKHPFDIGSHAIKQSLQVFIDLGWLWFIVSQLWI